MELWIVSRVFEYLEILNAVNDYVVNSFFNVETLGSERLLIYILTSDVNNESEGNFTLSNH